VSLYPGFVMHQRMRPVSHRFRYRTYNILIDLSRLAEAGAQSRFFSIGRFNLLSFHPADHGDGADLFAHAAGALRRSGIVAAPARILLLCYPRVLGYVFNPISVYFAYDARGRLIGVVYEVRNTFGERHSYVAPVREGEWDDDILRQERRKLFYVSPFNDLAQRYLFRLRPPGATVALRILQTDERGPMLAAALSARQADLTDRSVLGAFLSMPLMTAKVMAGIHWEALKLFIKGMRLKPRPHPPAALSFGDGAGPKEV
jgi:DUF1365 family protein